MHQVLVREPSLGAYVFFYPDLWFICYPESVFCLFMDSWFSSACFAAVPKYIYTCFLGKNSEELGSMDLPV